MTHNTINAVLSPLLDGHNIDGNLQLEYIFYFNVVLETALLKYLVESHLDLSNLFLELVVLVGDFLLDTFFPGLVLVHRLLDYVHSESLGLASEVFQFLVKFL